MRWSHFFLASAAAACTAGVAAAAPPSATDAELQQYASMFWHLVDTGTPHPDAAGFEFADPGMNQPGAFPFAGTLALFHNVYSSKINPDPTQCQTYKDVLDLLDENAEVRAKFRAYTTSKLFTSTNADPLVAQAHLLAVVNAISVADEFTVQAIDFAGPALASVGLKLAAGATLAPTAQLLTVPENATFEDALRAAVLAIHNSGSATLFDPLAVIRGTQPPLTAATDLAAILPGAGNTFTADPVFITSGDFAMLSVVRVDYGDKVYIADASLGMVFGPYARTSTLPVKDVLLAHPDLYTDGMAAVVISAKSAAACIVLVQFAPAVPPGWPADPLPEWPPTPGPVPGPLNTAPGWWPDPLPVWDCRNIPGTGVSPATCICSRTITFRRPTLECWWIWCTTEIQYAEQFEVCSSIGPCPPPPAGPPPSWPCVVTHEIFPQ
ncbi:MAG: hypothetical protein ACK5ZV_13430 [bacterium]|jgi:hypothetical protein